MNKRLIVFLNSQSVVTSNLLLKAILKNKKGIEIVGVIDTARSIIRKKNYLKTCLSLTLNLGVINSNHLHCMSSSIKRICAKERIALIQFKNNDINSLEALTFYESFNGEVNGLVIGCPRIISQNVINCFDKLINYHDSFLPAFKGLNATAWAIYENKTLSGYTFHNVNSKIDSGDIVFKKLLPVKKSWNIHQVLYLKIADAFNEMNRIMDYLFNNVKINYIDEPYYTSKYNYYSEEMKLNKIASLKSDKPSALDNKKIRKSFGI